MCVYEQQTRQAQALGAVKSLARNPNLSTVWMVPQDVDRLPVPFPLDRLQQTPAFHLLSRVRQTTCCPEPQSSSLL
eukprot:2688851-Rhodomonas_salina.3